MIKTESIKIIKERELSFFYTTFPSSLFLFIFPSPQFYYFPSSSSSFYCFLSFTHSFHFSFSTRFYKRLLTAIFSSFWNNVSWRKKLIIRQDAPLGFLLQSKFVCNGELVNSHNYLTNGAWNAETVIVFHFFEIEMRNRFCNSQTKLK